MTGQTDEQADDSARPAGDTAAADTAAAGTTVAGNGGDDTAAEVDFISAERLIFFSDAVVAIAITLLALALPLPRATTTSHEVLHDMWLNRDAYFAFFISFAVIANHWRAHHRLYRNVVRLDRHLITINLLWLLLVVITPFVTRLLSGNGGFGARFSIYAAIQIATIVMFLLMSRHIRSGHLFRAGATPPATRADDVALLAVAGMFAVSIPVALKTGSQWAFAIWVAAWFAVRAARRAPSRGPT
jgi:uncharacterized membrane protein